MLRDTLINSGELYVGRNVGEKILTDLESANTSIKIVTPYVSSDFIDLLIQKAQANIDVSLIMSDDFVNRDSKRLEIFKKLIRQIRHVDNRKKRKRKIGSIVTILSYLAIISFLVFGYKEKIVHFEYAGLLIPVLILIHILLKKWQIYTYTYEHLINFAVTMTPYSGPNNFNENHYLTHAKIFIIDNKLVYLGSMNFTKMGFHNNYETRIKISDSNVVELLSTEYDYLYSNSNTYYLNLDILARSIYSEPPN